MKKLALLCLVLGLGIAFVGCTPEKPKGKPAGKTDSKVTTGTTDEAAPKTDEAAPKTDEPAPKTDEPAPKTDEPAPKTDEPAVKEVPLDPAPPAKPEEKEEK